MGTTAGHIGVHPDSIKKTYQLMAKTRLLVAAILGISFLVIIGLLYIIIQNTNPPSSDRSDDGLEKKEAVATTSLLVAPNSEDHSAVEEYNERVKEAAEESQIVVIDEGCAVSPLVLDISLNESVPVLNNTATWHSILFEGSSDEELLFSIPAGTMLDFAPSAFGLSEGVYRYRCGGSPEEINNGLMYVTNGI